MRQVAMVAAALALLGIGAVLGPNGSGLAGAGTLAARPAADVNGGAAAPPHAEVSGGVLSFLVSWYSLCQ